MSVHTLFHDNHFYLPYQSFPLRATAIKNMFDGRRTYPNTEAGQANTEMG